MPTPTKNAPFIKRLGYALNGIIEAFKAESSFRLQIVAAIGALLFLIAMKASPLWWGLFLLNIVAILSAELFNTALEHFIDLIHPNTHPAIKIAKDCAAGAVLLLSCGAVAILICFLLTVI